MQEWKAACPLSHVSDDEPIGVKLDGKDIAIYSFDGEVFATDNVCSHAFALLSTGFQEGHIIECPLHGATFDIRTGKSQSTLCGDIRTFPVKIADDQVLVSLEEAYIPADNFHSDN